MTSMVTSTAPLREEMDWLIRQSRAPRLRTMREFAEQDVVIPDGPYEGRRFRCDRQPYTGLWFDAIDSGHWQRFAAVGPTQSGKTLVGSIIPTIYHLFEIGETVIFALPTMDMAGDKWREDLLPAIEASRYAALMPAGGKGSRGGGTPTAIQFNNGATLKFMSGGGNDKKRSAYTARVVVITEVDGMDESGQGSREADKITQIEARTRAFGARRRIYMECTASVKQGRIWREYVAGSEGRIAILCPHCGDYVTPEREHFVGWAERETVVAASEHAAFGCPSCAVQWTAEDRRQANQDSVLVHRGQSIEDGAVVGEPTATDTCGFRWSGVNNMFVPDHALGADMWRAARDPDEANAERQVCQFLWATPYEPPEQDLTELTVDAIIQRQLDGHTRGTPPKWAEYITVGVDVGKRQCHWVVVCWQPDATAHIMDYGVLAVPADAVGVEAALVASLGDFGDQLDQGWPGDLVPDAVWVDSGWQSPVVYGVVRGRQGWRPVKGYGTSQQNRYTQPRRTGAGVVRVGHRFYVSPLPEAKVNLYHVDADYWKAWAHARLSTPVADPGAMTLFDAPRVEHLQLARHVTAERQTEEFVVGRGTVTKMVQRYYANHWLDALAYACAAGADCGVTPPGAQSKPSTQPNPRAPGVRHRFRTPDGRSFVRTR